jgi:hypothetical protein
MATPGRNEGFRLLDDFTCEAVSEAGGSPPGDKRRGVNPGMHVVTELVSGASQPPVPAERIAELRKLSTRQLLALVHLHGPALRAHELLVIHDIAAERLGGDQDPFSEGAIELSREVMLAAVNRSAS